MPSVSCAGVQLAGRVDVDTHHRSPHVRKPIRGGEQEHDETPPQPNSPSPPGRASTPRLLRPSQAARTTPSMRRPAAIGRSTMPTRCSSRSTCPGCSVAAARRFRWPSSCARCATPVAAAGDASSSRTAKRANPRRSRTAGCCATGRISCSTGCGWPPRWSAHIVRYVYVSDRPVGRRRHSRACPTAARDLRRGRRRGDRPSNLATSQARRRQPCDASTADRPNRQTNRLAPSRKASSGLPTLVSNVETLANLPFIHEHGSQSFRAVGTPMSPGTFLATITGGGRPAALYEIPHGAAFSDLLDGARACRPTRCAAR